MKRSLLKRIFSLIVAFSLLTTFSVGGNVSVFASESGESGGSSDGGSDGGGSDTNNNGGSDTGNNGGSDTGNNGGSDTGNNGGSDTGNNGNDDTTPGSAPLGAPPIPDPQADLNENESDITLTLAPRDMDTTEVGKNNTLIVMSNIAGPMWNNNGAYIIITLDPNEPITFSGWDENVIEGYEYIDAKTLKLTDHTALAEGGIGGIDFGVVFENRTTDAFKCATVNGGKGIAALVTANLYSEGGSVLKGPAELTVYGTADLNWSFTNHKTVLTPITADYDSGEASEPAGFTFTVANQNLQANYGVVYTGTVTLTQTIQMPYGAIIEPNTATGKSEDNIKVTIAGETRTDYTIGIIKTKVQQDDGKIGEEYTITYTFTNPSITDELQGFTANIEINGIKADNQKLDETNNNNLIKSTVSGICGDIYNHGNEHKKDLIIDSKTAGTVSTKIVLKQLLNYSFNDHYKEVKPEKTVAIDGGTQDLVLIHPFATDEEKQPIFTIDGFSNPYVASGNYKGKTLTDYAVVDDFSDINPYLKLVEITRGEYKEYDNVTEFEIQISKDGINWVKIAVSGACWDAFDSSKKLDMTTVSNFTDEYKYIRYYFGTVKPGFGVVTAPTLKFQLREGTDGDAFQKLTDEAQADSTKALPVMHDNSAYVTYTFKSDDAGGKDGKVVKPGYVITGDELEDLKNAEAVVATVAFDNKLPLSLGNNKSSKNANNSRKLTDNNGKDYYYYYPGDTVNYELKIKVDKMATPSYGVSLVNPVVTDYLQASDVDFDSITSMVPKVYSLPSGVTTVSDTYRLTSGTDYTFAPSPPTVSHTYATGDIRYLLDSTGTAKAYELVWNFTHTFEQGRTLVIQYDVKLAENPEQATVKKLVCNEYSVKPGNEQTVPGPGGPGGWTPGEYTGLYGYNIIKLDTDNPAIGIKKELVNSTDANRLFKTDETVEYKISIKNISNNDSHVFDYLIFDDIFADAFVKDELYILDLYTNMYEDIAGGVTNTMFVLTDKNKDDYYLSNKITVDATMSNYNLNIKFGDNTKTNDEKELNLKKDEVISFTVKLRIKDADAIKESAAYKLAYSSGNAQTVDYLVLKNTAKLSGLEDNVLMQINGTANDGPWGDKYERKLAGGTSNYVEDSINIKVEKSRAHIALNKAVGTSTFNLDTIKPNTTGDYIGSYNGPTYTITTRNMSTDVVKGSKLIDRLPVGQIVISVTVQKGSEKPYEPTWTTGGTGAKGDEQLLEIELGDLDAATASNSGVLYTITYKTLLDKDVILGLKEFTDGDFVSAVKIVETNYVGLFSEDFGANDRFTVYQSSTGTIFKGNAVIKADNLNWNDKMPARYGLEEDIDGLLSKFAEASADISYTKNPVKPGIVKKLLPLSAGQDWKPKQIATWEISCSNEATTKTINGFKVVDVLPADFKLPTAADYPNSTFPSPVVITYAGQTLVEGTHYTLEQSVLRADGRLQLTWNFPTVAEGGIELKNGETLKITLKTKLPDTYFSGAVNEAYIIPWYDNFYQKITNKGDIKDSGTTKNEIGIAKRSVKSDAGIELYGNLKLTSVKTIEEVADPNNNSSSFKAPHYIEVVPNRDGGNKIEYTLNLTNGSKDEITSNNMVLIDILPYYRDKGVVAVTRDRDTTAEWKLEGTRVDAVSIVDENGRTLLNPNLNQYKVDYSDEVFDGIEDLDKDDWLGTPKPDKWKDVIANPTAFRVTVVPEIIIKSGQTLMVTVSAIVPETATNGTIVWNSFGYECNSSYFKSEGTRLRSEPPRVGVKIADTSVKIQKFIGDKDNNVPADEVSNLNREFKFNVYNSDGELQGEPIVLNKSNNYTNWAYDLNFNSDYTIKEVNDTIYRIVFANSDNNETVKYLSDGTIKFNTGSDDETEITFIKVYNKRRPTSDHDDPGDPGDPGKPGNPGNPNDPGGNNPPSEEEIISSSVPWNALDPQTETTPEEEEIPPREIPFVALKGDEEEVIILEKDVPLGILPVTGGVVGVQAILFGLAGIVSGIFAKRRKP